MSFLTKTLATAIGSLPYQGTKEAVDFVFSCFKNDVIFWPQLPRRSFLEQMTVQYCEKFPGIKIDLAQKKVWVDTKSKNYSERLEALFSHYLDDDVDYFSISPDYASGLYEFTDRLKPECDASLIKGQIVGPVTLGMMLLDDASKPVIYQPDLKDAVVKLLSMKARWQIRKLKGQNLKVKTIIFIDEPYLVSFGSSFFTLKREDVLAILNEVIAAVHSEGALCGIHCCANTDWSLILDTDIDILSFDAYGYLDNLLLYGGSLNKFILRGGVLSCGIVPNNEEAYDKAMKDKLAARIKQDKKKIPGLDKLLITASCGCGSLDVKLSEAINCTCVELARDLNS